MKKKITIEDLAIMVKRGFDETAKKVDMEARFADIDKCFADMDKRFADIDKRLNGTATKNDIIRLEKEIEKLDQNISHIGYLPIGIERRLDRVEDDLRVVKTKVGIR